MDTFGNKLKKLRYKCKLSQKQIAKKLEISRSAYANYEQGRREPNLKTLKKISILFHCTCDYLIGKDEF